MSMSARGPCLSSIPPASASPLPLCWLPREPQSRIVVRPNLDFEYELAADTRSHTPSPKLLTLIQSLAPLLSLLVEGPHTLLEPGAAPLPTERGEVRRYLPWGWTPSTLREAEQIEPLLPVPPLQVVRRVQHRAFGLELEQRWKVGLDAASFLESEASLDRACRDMPPPVVFKHPFGMAGRDRVISDRTTGGLLPSERAWCLKVLREGHGLVAEPWLDRIRDFSTQWWLPERGAPVLLGVLEQIVGPRGSWEGHRLGALSFPPTLVEVGRQAALECLALGYCGPLGIDAFEYRTASGSNRLRPIVELNARHTMGMCALGLCGYVPPGAIAEWRPRAGGLRILPFKDSADNR